MQHTSTSIPAIDGGSPARSTFLDFSRPVISNDEKQAVMDVLESGWLTSGKQVQEFEREFAQYTGSKYAVSVNSCTAGLFLILKGLRIGPGDEVITSSNTFPATANVVEHLGAKVVFCDIRLSDGNMDVDQLTRLINPATKAIIPVHYAGIPCDMDELNRISNQYLIPIISDSAHAIETRFKGKSVSQLSFASAYSFYATKNLTTAEGGMITTDNEELYRKAKILRLHGLSDDAESRYTQKGKHGYDLLDAGFKCNMPDILAALGRAQLKKIDSNHKKRKELYQHYMELLESIEGITTIKLSNLHRNAYHLFPILIDFSRLSCDKDYFMSAMKCENIGVSQHFRPLHLYTFYREKYLYQRGDYPQSEKFGDSVITLPFNQYISKEDVKAVVEAVEKLIFRYRK